MSSKHTSKRVSRNGLRLASALVAAGLALTALPGAALADDGGPLTLTEEQAERLGEQLSVDPYEGAAEAPEPKAGNSLQETGTASGLTPTRAGGFETVRGLADTVPLAGTGGGYAVVHALGNISRVDAEGNTVWQRDNYSLHDEWQVTNTRPWQPNPYPARITMGYSPLAPSSTGNGKGYATGDLTGDGTADLVFTADVGTLPYRPFKAPGTTLSTGTFVTVLDGKTGTTLWSQIFAGGYQIALVDKTLVVADSPGVNTSSPKEATTTLQAFTFASSGGKLTATKAWSYDTGERAARWGALKDIGGGQIAAGWNKKVGTTIEGHALVIDAADGSKKWQHDGSLYPRQFAYDAARGRLLAVEQADYTVGVRYELAAYDPKTGARTTLDERVNAAPLALLPGDLTGDRKAEYAVSEATLDDNGFLNATTVRALDGGDGSTELWSHTVKRDEEDHRDGPVAFGLKIADRQLLVSSYTKEIKGAAGFDALRSGALTAYNGRDGEVRWEKRGPVASTSNAQVFRADDETYVRTVDGDQNVREYRVAGGRESGKVPLTGDLTEARSTDLNGDGVKDVITGGESHGLWAYDGASLLKGKRKQLWKAILPGSVHRLELADTDGDRKPEVLVAAETEALVVNARTGRIKERIDGHGQFVWSVAGADLDGDRDAEVLVPTDKVRAYRGSGSRLWEYAGPQGVVFSDVTVSEGTVHVAYNSVGALDVESAAVGGVALKARDGKVKWKAEPKAADGGSVVAAQLANSTFASSEIPYADGHAVVYTWIVRDAAGKDLSERVEIRDGRTGEVVKAAEHGGPFVHGSYFTGEEGLIEARAVTYSTFRKGGEVTEVNTLPLVTSGQFVRGPGGQRLLLGAVQGGIYLYDPAILSGEVNYPDQLAKISAYECGANYASDLDADGVDEVVLLNPDDRGDDQVIELSGGRVRGSSQPVHGLAVVKLGSS
ncbi:VCBS repeat-containing protein [Streptomyces sp. NBC_01304]|uniref:VCBS repeat-containing protein n=1 Tax=Streptomyces sp. NBC_01304 TaxID=2903818 RepID=UPI002E154894|nr:VCBS repeat-containing protein [Streptomyces sp. NBC_01304]